MIDNEIIVGHTYRAKRPRKRPITDEYDDRTILWIGYKWCRRNLKDEKLVQYDSISIGTGRHYPCVTVERFLKWADRDLGVTSMDRNTLTGIQGSPATDKEASNG